MGGPQWAASALQAASPPPVFCKTRILPGRHCMSVTRRYNTGTG